MSIALQEQSQPVSSSGGGGSSVNSVFGRTGDVTAQANDYAVADISGLSAALNAKAAGAASSTDNTLPRFDGTGGKTLQGSGVVVDDSNNVSGVAGLTLTGNITLSTGGATVDGVDLTALATTVSANTTAISGKADAAFTINTQTGTTYTLVLSDAGKLIDMSNAGAIALTIPANAAVAFPVGTIITVLQAGAGQVTVGINSDTLNGRNGLKTAGQWAVITLIKRTSTAWVLSGDSTT